MIKTVFFDAMGTLIYLPRSVGYHYKMVTERHGLHLGEEVLNSAFRAAWKRMPARLATKKPRPDDDKGWWRELVSQVLEIALEGKATKKFNFEACFEDIYNHFTRPDVWKLYPESLHALEVMGKNYRLGVISNFDGRLRVILDQLGVLGRFEKVIISSEAGADKPAAHIFEHALDVFHVRPNKALHVGDDPVNDWQAAAAAGMNVYKLERPGNSLEGLAEYLDSFSRDSK